MRIHVQSIHSDPNGLITPAQWHAVFGADSHHVVSFGHTPADLRAAEPYMEVLLIATRAVRSILPLNAPRLKILSVTSAGTEMLSPFDWLPPGVALLNNSGTHAVKTGEYALMAVLMLANQLPFFIGAQHDARWQPRRARSLAGRRLTIVGLGAIGAHAAMLARSFGLNVTGIRSRPAAHPACSEVAGIADLDRILPNSDYLLLALPGGDATRHLLDRRRLALLPKGAGIINVGRGSAIDETALCDLLTSGHLGGAVLDVFEQEPLASTSRVWSTPNLIVTPHISADDPDSYHPLTLRILAENLVAFAAGQPMPNHIDPASGLRYSRDGMDAGGGSIDISEAR